MTPPKIISSNKYIRQLYLAYQKLIRLFVPVEFISFSSISQNKNSNRLYAFGSGSSLCDYTEDMWNKVSSHDSIGFNFFFLHKHVPSYYVSEASLDLDNMHKIFSNFALLETEYDSTVKLWKEDIVSYVFRRQVMSAGASYVKSVPFDCRSKCQLSSKILKNIKSLQLRRESNALSVCSQGSTLDWIIDFALLLGYEELILCGFDLIDSQYFYNTERCVEALRKDLLKPVNALKNISLLHSTNDPARCFGGISAIEVVKVYANELPRSGLSIFSPSDNSVLSAVFPTHDWNS